MQHIGTKLKKKKKHPQYNTTAIGIHKKTITISRRSFEKSQTTTNSRKTELKIILQFIIFLKKVTK